MKKKKENNFEDDLQPEYDFYQLPDVVQGKYANKYQQGTNIIHLDPDVARVFNSDESVNQALRSLINIAKASL
jgi:hypothetical protein